MRPHQHVLGMAVAILVLSGCALSPQAKEAKYLAKGKKAFDRKEYAIAVLHFRNAVTARPRDAEPHYQLGLALLEVKDYYPAASEFRKASELNPKHTGAQLKLATLLATSPDKKILEEAQKRCRDVLALLPDDVEALYVLAAAELRLGKPDDAQAHLEQALRKSPTSLNSSVALAQIRLGRQNAAGAEAALKEAVNQAPKSPDARIYLAGFYLAQGRNADAEQQLRDALKIDSKNAAALMNLAALQARAGQTDQAEQTYRQVSALEDKQYRPAHALFLFQSGKRDQAIAELEKLLAPDPSDRSIRTELVKAYLSLNRLADAERVLTAALKKNGRDVDALLQRSRIYLASGKLDNAQSDLNQVLHFRNNSADAHYVLSLVAKARENTALQKLELGEVLRLDPNILPARIELARLLIADRGADAALKLLDETPAQQRNDINVVVQRNWALLALGRKADALTGVGQALSAGTIPDVLLQDAVLKMDKADYAGARASVETALRENPNEARGLALLVQTYAAQKQLPVGLRKAREYAQRAPASADVQFLLGQLLATNGDRAGARLAYEAAKVAKPDLVNAELALAELDTAEGKRDDARKRFAGIIAVHPTNIPTRLLLAQLEAGDGKPGTAIEHFRKVLELDDKNAVALNGLAYLLSETRQPDEAIKYAQKAKEVLPNEAAVDDTLGWTYFQKGMYSLAVTHLESAIAKGDSARRRYHLAMAYLKAGDLTRGRQALDAALKMDPRLPEAQAARQAFGAAGK